MNKVVELAKYEALGNDFLVLVDMEGRWPLSEDLARAVCDRHRGFGADGLLRASGAPDGAVFSQPAGAGPAGALEEGRAEIGRGGEPAEAGRAALAGSTGREPAKVGGGRAPAEEGRTAPAAPRLSDGRRSLAPAVLSFELRNADGSEAEMSGNGLRCLAHAAIDAGVLKAAAGDSFGVLTPAGRREVSVRELRDGWMWASTEMGVPEVKGEPAACNVDNGQVFVDVGNPHLVVLGPAPSGLDVAGLGRALSEQHGGATGGVNVEFVALGPGRDVLTMRVWE